MKFENSNGLFCVYICLLIIHSFLLQGGNQRELARLKNQKKQQSKKGESHDGNKGTSLINRKERCDLEYDEMFRVNMMTMVMSR